MGPIAGILVGMLLLGAVIVWFITRLSEGMDVRKFKRERRAIRQDLAQIDRTTSKIERAAKLRVAEALINGRKCPVCMKVKTRDGFIAIGEDHRDRPIEVCGDCYVEIQSEGGTNASV